KIGWSKNPKKRLSSLQTASPDELVLLGTIQGGLEVETELHRRFAKHKLQGEWFGGAILGEVQAIIAREKANPQQPKMNVIVVGDSPHNFLFSTDEHDNANKERLQALVFQALSEIHANTPIGCVIIGGNRQVEAFAYDWATQNKAEVYHYQANWRRYGKG